MTSTDPSSSSYHEWLLLNVSNDLDDLADICREYYPFVYAIALTMLCNPQIACSCALESLANTLLNSRKYPGGAPLTWLANLTLAACHSKRAVSCEEYLWKPFDDVQQAQTWQVICGLDTALRLQAVLHFGFGLSRRDIAAVFRQPAWLIADHLDTVRDLCSRKLQWAGAPLPSSQVERTIHDTINHQTKNLLPSGEQVKQIASELQTTIQRKRKIQKLRIYLQQGLLALLLIAVFIILFRQ